MISLRSFGRRKNAGKKRNGIRGNRKGKTILLAGAAVLCLLAAAAVGLSQKEEETVAVIGGADGPTSIFVRSNDGSALDAVFEEDADQ